VKKTAVYYNIGLKLYLNQYFLTLFAVWLTSLEIKSWYKNWLIFFYCWLTGLIFFSIYYSLSLSTELNSRGQKFIDLIAMLLI